MWPLGVHQALTGYLFCEWVPQKSIKNPVKNRRWSFLRIYLTNKKPVYLASSVQYESILPRWHSLFRNILQSYCITVRNHFMKLPPVILISFVKQRRIQNLLKHLRWTFFQIDLRFWIGFGLKFSQLCFLQLKSS